MPGFPGYRGNLHGSVSDLRDLQGEQSADQVGMGARQRDLRSAQSPGHADDVTLDPLAVPVGFSGRLLHRRDYALGVANLDYYHTAGVSPGVALHHPGDDLAL